MSKIDANSTRFAAIAAQEASMALPEPPVHLDADALAFWEDVIRSKRVTAWTPSDLLIACSLCRDLALVEELQKEIAEHGLVLVGEKRSYSNPACNLLDQAQRRILAATRGLQIHANATQGPSHHHGQKNTAARDIAAQIEAADDLIARPRH